MSFFLAQQDVRNKERRRKTVRRWLMHFERIALVILCWCGAVGLLFGGYLAVVGLPLFAVEEVVVHGELQMLSADIIRDLSGIERGGNVFHVAVADVHQRLQANPWIAEVAVRRKLPHTIWIYVSERTPAAILNLHGLYLVDEDGTIFKTWEPGDPSDLPVLSGVTDVQVDAEGYGRSPQVRALLQLKGEFERTPMGEQFGASELLIDRFGRYAVVTAQPSIVVRLGTAFQPEQLERLRQVWPALQEKRVAAVDVSIERKVIVR